MYCFVVFDIYYARTFMHIMCYIFASVLVPVLLYLYLKFWRCYVPPVPAVCFASRKSLVTTTTTIRLLITLCLAPCVCVCKWDSNKIFLIYPTFSFNVIMLYAATAVSRKKSQLQNLLLTHLRFFWEQRKNAKRNYNFNNIFLH